MKAVIVTGASTGIGHAAAARLAESGFRVLACVRKPGDAEKWKKVPNAQPLFLDVTDEASIHASLKECRPILEKAEEVHLVNNAGIAVAGPVEAVPLSRWKEQFEVNVFGLLRVTQAFLPFIRPTRGRIVNVSSVSGLVTSPYLGPYSASKFAVEAISDALRRELRQFGVQVVIVEPGPIATPIWEKNLGRKDALLEELAEDQKALYGKDLKRMQKMVSVEASRAVPVERVSEVIEKALTSSRPRTRYVIGRKTIGAEMLFAQHMPDRWMDALILKEFR